MYLLSFFASLLWGALNCNYIYYYDLLGQIGFANLECEVSDFFLTLLSCMCSEE